MTAVVPSRLSVLPLKHHDSSCYEMELEGRLSSVKLRKAFKSGQSIFEVNMFNPYPTAFPYGNGMVLHFYQQQESSTTKTIHKVIIKGLKTYV